MLINITLLSFCSRKTLDHNLIFILYCDNMICHLKKKCVTLFSFLSLVVISVSPEETTTGEGKQPGVKFTRLKSKTLVLIKQKILCLNSKSYCLIIKSILLFSLVNLTPVYIYSNVFLPTCMHVHMLMNTYMQLIKRESLVLKLV